MQSENESHNTRHDAHPGNSAEYQPRCNVCGSEDNFVLKEKEREGTLCGNCGASSRHRAVVYTLGIQLGLNSVPVCAWPRRKDLRILESSGRGSYPMMFREKFEYYNTEFAPGSPGMSKPYTAQADFQQLAYPDNDLDVVLATDVFEHVREDEKGFTEIYRTLKPGGSFIMTVPYVHEWDKTVVRVRVEGDNDIHLLPPEYHGGGGQTLAYRTYGRDLMNSLEAHRFSVGFLKLDLPRHAITPQYVFVGVKGPAIDLTAFHFPPPTSPAGIPRASPLFLFRLFLAVKYNLFSVRHFGAEVVRKITDRF